MSYSAKEIEKNILSVFAGVLTGFALIWLLKIILLWALASPSNDDYSPENITLFEILTVAIIIVSCVLAGIVTAKISSRKVFFHVLITSILLLLIMLGLSSFELKNYSIADWVGIAITVQFTLIGGYIIKRKETIPI